MSCSAEVNGVMLRHLVTHRPDVVGRAEVRVEGKLAV